MNAARCSKLSTVILHTVQTEEWASGVQPPAAAFTRCCLAPHAPMGFKVPIPFKQAFMRVFKTLVPSGRSTVGEKLCHCDEGIILG